MLSTSNVQQGGSSAVLAVGGDADVDTWAQYYKQQRATMSSGNTFTWGGRYTYKGLDTQPDERCLLH
jgi:hypothetical protein